MILCRDDHPEICYGDQEGSCPLCDTLAEKRELEYQIDDLQEKLNNK